MAAYAGAPPNHLTHATPLISSCWQDEEQQLQGEWRSGPTVKAFEGHDQPSQKL